LRRRSAGPAAGPTTQPGFASRRRDEPPARPNRDQDHRILGGHAESQVARGHPIPRAARLAQQIRHARAAGTAIRPRPRRPGRCCSAPPRPCRRPRRAGSRTDRVRIIEPHRNIPSAAPGGRAGSRSTAGNCASRSEAIASGQPLRLGESLRPPPGDCCSGGVEGEAPGERAIIRARPTPSLCGCGSSRPTSRPRPRSRSSAHRAPSSARRPSA